MRLGWYGRGRVAWNELKWSGLGGEDWNKIESLELLLEFSPLPLWSGSAHVIISLMKWLHDYGHCSPRRSCMCTITPLRRVTAHEVISQA